jgi:molybdopterin-guanine dinucleotide biosynthesis protein A
VSFLASQPVGVILAGGLGRRLGGSKATVKLNGRPLLTYALGTLQQVLGIVVIVAKADSELPSLPEVEVWMEPAEPRHPLTGIVHALGVAEGRPIVVCACDLPLVSAAVVAELAAVDPHEATAVIARSEGRLQPLLGRYQPEAMEPLSAALEAGLAMVDAVTALGARPYDVADPELLFNVNTPEDLLRAGALLEAQPKVKS